jgi:hypothetical protein
MLNARQRWRSYRSVLFSLFSMLVFTTDSEEKDHGNTRQEVSREVRRHDRQAGHVRVTRGRIEVGPEVIRRKIGWQEIVVDAFLERCLGEECIGGPQGKRREKIFRENTVD